MNAKCELCGGLFTKTGITRHLESCLAAHASVAQPENTASGAFHLKVEGKYDKTYWLHLHAPGDATLDDVDVFLRRIWLECCGHMSEFTRAGAGRSRASWDELDSEFEQNPSLRSILKRGDKFDYTYDFGSST